MNRTGGKIRMDLRELHPSTQIGKDSNYWCGVEVEGYARGMKTVFLADKIEKEDEFETFISHVVSYADQVFITETFSAWIWYSEKVFPRIAYLARPLFISVLPQNVDGVEYQRATFPAFRNAHLIVRIFGAQWMKKMRTQDQISIGVPYDLVTYEVVRGVATLPQDYEEDFT